VKRSSLRYPPSTGYRRPAVRRFYVWEDRCITYGYSEGKWGRHPWRWCCTHCDPPAFGFRAKAGAFEAIMAHMPRHFQRRAAHHRWARTRRPVEDVQLPEEGTHE
jgi:hypothetical protein